jgi:hypothetical protein
VLVIVAGTAGALFVTGTVVGGGSVVAGGTVVVSAGVVAVVSDVEVVVSDVEVVVSEVDVCVTAVLGVTVVGSVAAGEGTSVDGGAGGASVVGEPVSATESVLDGSTAPKPPRTCVAVAGVVAIVAVAVVASGDEVLLAAGPCVAAASNPVGSVPTLDVTVGGVDAVDAAVAGAGARSAGPYRFVVIDAGATQFRRATIAPTCTNCPPLCATGVGRGAAWKNCVGAGRVVARELAATCVWKTGN